MNNLNWKNFNFFTATLIFVLIVVISTLIFTVFCRYYEVNGDGGSISAYINLLTLNATMFTGLIAIVIYKNWKKQVVYPDVLKRLELLKDELNTLQYRYIHLIDNYTLQTGWDLPGFSKFMDDLRETKIKKENAPTDSIERWSNMDTEMVMMKHRQEVLSLYYAHHNALKSQLESLYQQYDVLKMICEYENESIENLKNDFKTLISRLEEDYKIKLEATVYDLLREEERRKFSIKDIMQKNIFLLNEEHEGIKSSFNDKFEELDKKINKFLENFN